LVASFIDIDHMEIPLVSDGDGAILGLIFGTLFWPQLRRTPDLHGRL